MTSVRDLAREFKKTFPFTVAKRTQTHAKLIEEHLSEDEEVIGVFAGQKTPIAIDFFSTYLVALTNKRIIVAQKRLIFGYYFISITPDMFNDLSVESGIIWGKVLIDTIKEIIILRKIDKRALAIIQNTVTEYMQQKKKEAKDDKEETTKEEIKKEEPKDLDEIKAEIRRLEELQRQAEIEKLKKLKDEYEKATDEEKERLKDENRDI